MNNEIYLGKIVNTHGIKGELKLLSDFDYLEKVLTPNFKLYIDNVEYFLTSFRYHQEYILIKINNWENINDVLFLKGKDVYINRTDLKLRYNEYLLQDLIGAKVLDNKTLIGQVTEILLGKKYNFIRINKNEKSFLVPLIAEYIVSFDSQKGELYLKNSSSLQF